MTGRYLDGKSEWRRASIQFPPVDEARGEHVLSAMDGIAEAHGASMEAVALAWLRHQPTVASIILGVKNMDQLAANLAAADLTFSNDEPAASGKIGAPAIEYPGWMLEQGSAARTALLRTGHVPAQH